MVICNCLAIVWCCFSWVWYWVLVLVKFFCRVECCCKRGVIWCWRLLSWFSFCLVIFNLFKFVLMFCCWVKIGCNLVNCLFRCFKCRSCCFVCFVNLFFWCCNCCFKFCCCCCKFWYCWKVLVNFVFWFCKVW